LPLSTDNQMQTGRKSIKSISSSVKNAKFVTPKFMIKDSENESSAKKNFSSINSSNSKNKNGINVNNNMENTSLCLTGSMTNVNNLNSNNSNLHVYLPVQSQNVYLKNEKKNIISKDDSIRLNSFNLTGNNHSILASNMTNNNISHAYNLSGNSVNNIGNKGNYVENEFQINNNYFREIMDSFKEKTSVISNHHEKLNMSLHENQENNKNNTNHEKIPSNINYVEGSCNNILINSISGKIKFEPNNNHLRYRRNKHNSINFKENNLMQSLVTGPTLKTKMKKYKSHSITNFPISPQESKSLNYEYNFPFNDQESRLVPQDNITSNTNSNIQITNKNKNLVYSSYDSKEDDPRISLDKNTINSRNIVYSSFNSKGYIASESNYATSTNINYCKLNERSIRSNFNNKVNYSEGIGNDEFNYLSKLNSQKSIFSKYENEANIMNFSKNVNISNNNINNISVNQKKMENLKKEIKKNIVLNNQNYLNYTYNSGNYGNKINNFTELQRMNYQNNLLYLINVLHEKILTVKHKTLNQILLYSEEILKNNRRYALKMIMRIVKRRVVFSKLKFLTRCNKFKF
jgi:hypothetical protein